MHRNPEHPTQYALFYQSVPFQDAIVKYCWLCAFSQSVIKVNLVNYQTVHYDVYNKVVIAPYPVQLDFIMSEAC